MSAKQKRKFAFPTRTLVFTALLTALVVAATVVLGFRTGDFFFNCGDTVIFVTAALLGPVPAMLAGGIGSFFADLAVYPATMFFTLVIKGLEGLLCGLLMKLFRTSRRGKLLAPVTGGASMLFSVALACVLLYIMRLDSLRARFRLSGEKHPSAPPYCRLPKQ